jgi:hypothetical protein
MQIGATGQALPIRAPSQPIKNGLWLLNFIPGLGGQVPELNDPVPPTAGKKFAIWAPSHPVYDPFMIAPYLRWRLPSHLPDGDLPIRVPRDNLGAIRLQSRS